MRSPLTSLTVRLRGRLGQRGAAFLLALFVELLLALLLLFLAPVMPGTDKGEIPSVFGIDLGDSEAEAPDAAPEQTQQRRAESGKAQPTPPRPQEPPPPERPQQPPPPVELPPDIVRMSRPDYRASDITGRGTPATGRTETEGAPEVASGGGARPGDSPVVGKAPNGEPLYAAAWYRRPTSAELSPYISRRATGPGWGLVACRTISGYRVEDCQVLGEGPRGSGYGGAVRQAAWQFRVRPPRVGGKEMFGTWVSIRITYGELKDEGADAE